MKTLQNKKTFSFSLSANEKIGLISNLSTMLAAGIPILEAVNSLLEDAKGSSRKVLETVRDDLAQGEKLSVTFAKFPKAFNSVTVNLIKASEEAGTLGTILKDLKDNIRKEMEFSDKIKGAMTYPVLILMVFVGVLFMMLIVVVPKISSVFLRLHVDLPLPTKILIFLSQLLLQHTFLFFGTIGGIIFSCILLYRKNPAILLRPLFALPLISKLIAQIDLVRFSHTMFLLLNSGLPLTTALDLAQEVVVRADIRSVILRAKDMVASGKKLSEGFRGKHRHVPTIMVKLLEVGDKTGTLDKSMQDVSEYLDYEVSATLKTITIVLEPVMLVLVGVCVGGMMLAIIAPIYGLIGKVGGR